jgi:hypothetical protein
MKKILIIGDSWGIIPSQLWQLQTIHQKDDHNSHVNHSNDTLDWLDFKLLQLGHSVSNRSWGGCANWYQLTNADVFLNSAKKHNFHIDLVIWFHTEILRDLHKHTEKHMHWIKEYGLEGIIDKLCFETYDYATRLHNLSPNTKWAIIGGHAPIRKNLAHMLDWADFRIDDYRSSILNNLEIPDCHTLSFTEAEWNYIKTNNLMPLDQIIKEFEKKEYIESICQNKTLFYDTVHPSPYINKSLSSSIIEYFNL